MANERALGISFIYAAQTWRQMIVAYGEDEARSLFGLTNNVVVFGGGKDIHFYREISDLLGTTRVCRQTISDGPGGVGTSRGMEDIPILRPEHIRLLPERHALVVAENAPPILARLRRCIDGRTGRALLEDQRHARARVGATRSAAQHRRRRDQKHARYAAGGPRRSGRGQAARRHHVRALRQAHRPRARARSDGSLLCRAQLCPAVDR